MKLGKRYFCASMFLALTLRADVTIRYQTEFKPAAALQPLMEQFMKTAQTSATSSIRMKGNLGYTTAGKWVEIFDFAKGEVTLIDPAHKTYASLPVSQLGDKMAAAMPSATPNQMMGAVQQLMASMKTSVDSNVTGKTEDIQGVHAEERDVIFTVDIPMPPGAMKQAGPSMNMKMVMHIWTAKKEEALRVPAIRELTGYQAWQKYIMNPAGMFETLTAKMPGVAKIVGPLVEEIYKNQAVILRTHTEIYMPFLAGVAKQMAAQGQSFPAIDPDAPLFEMNQEVAELSSTSVDASLFDTPKDYTVVPADDMFREMFKAQSAAAAPKTPAVQ